MGRKGKNTPLNLRKLVIIHYKNGKKYKEIAEMLNIKQNTIGDIVRRYKNEGRIEFKKQTGQPKKLTEMEERNIVRKIKVNPRLSAPKIVAEVKTELKKSISESTVRRIIKREGYNGRVARKKPFVNLVNRRNRLNFAKEHIQKDVSWWDDVIFLDESKFNIFGSDGKTMVWRKPNEELKGKNITPTVKHGGGSVMVWGCISAKGVGNLVFIDGIMNKESYLTILKDNLKQSAEKMGILSTFKLYQDNDPKHKAHVVREWLLYNCPKVINTPSQSPDMNPIENLWDHLDRRVREKPVSSKNDLKKRLQEEWNKIGVDYLQKCIKNMPNRLSEVIKNKGYPTRY